MADWHHKAMIRCEGGAMRQGPIFIAECIVEVCSFWDIWTFAASFISVCEPSASSPDLVWLAFSEEKFFFSTFQPLKQFDFKIIGYTLFKQYVSSWGFHDHQKPMPDMHSQYLSSLHSYFHSEIWSWIWLWIVNLSLTRRKPKLNKQCAIWNSVQWLSSCG